MTVSYHRSFMIVNNSAPVGLDLEERDRQKQQIPELTTCNLQTDEKTQISSTIIAAEVIFLRRIITIFTLQAFMMTIMACLFTLFSDIILFPLTKIDKFELPIQGTFFFACLSWATLYLLAKIPGFSRSLPNNYIFVALYSLFIGGFLASFTVLSDDPNVILLLTLPLQAVSLCLLVCINADCQLRLFERRSSGRPRDSIRHHVPALLRQPIRRTAGMGRPGIFDLHVVPARDAERDGDGSQEQGPAGRRLRPRGWGRPHPPHSRSLQCADYLHCDPRHPHHLLPPNPRRPLRHEKKIAR